MKDARIIFIFFITSAMGCSNAPDAVKVVADDEKYEWFNKRPWLGNSKVLPDQSIDVAAFHDHYTENPSLWDSVFRFMEETDLEHLQTGSFRIAGDSVRVIVQQYDTRDAGELNYEAHQKYIDLQYVISGKELIGVAGLDQYSSIVEPYDEVEDIGFYEIKDGILRSADDRVFFIFFPDDAHMPCIRDEERLSVKKIVFKIPVIV
jgi:YhcH/YjgK/YiaL family protein